VNSDKELPSASMAFGCIRESRGVLGPHSYPLGLLLVSSSGSRLAQGQGVVS